eukprot:1510061-Pleurochrysis_carterae.AAC.1
MTASNLGIQQSCILGAGARARDLICHIISGCTILRTNLPEIIGHLPLRAGQRLDIGPVLPAHVGERPAQTG